jgi:hypothetical protein
LVGLYRLLPKYFASGTWTALVAPEQRAYKKIKRKKELHIDKDELE